MTSAKQPRLGIMHVGISILTNYTGTNVRTTFVRPFGPEDPIIHQQI